MSRIFLEHNYFVDREDLLDVWISRLVMIEYLFVVGCRWSTLRFCPIFSLCVVVICWKKLLRRNSMSCYRTQPCCLRRGCNHQGHLNKLTDLGSCCSGLCSLRIHCLKHAPLRNEGLCRRRRIVRLPLCLTYDTEFRILILHLYLINFIWKA